MFKKSCAIVLSLAMSLSLALTGCGQTKPPAVSSDPNVSTSSAPVDPVTNETPEIVKSMVWASGAAGGVTYPLAVQCLEMINNLYPDAYATLIEGTAGTNLSLVNSGECLMGHTMTTTAAAGLKGEAPFSEVLDNFYAIARIQEQAFQIVAPKSLGITSFDEIVEKKMPINFGTTSAGSSGDTTMQLVLEAYGVSYDWIEKNGGKVTLTSQSDGGMLFQDGHLDVWAGLSSAPTPYIEEMAVSQDLVILEINQDVIDKLVNEYGYGRCEVPAGTYGIENTVETVASSVVLIINKAAPDDFAYNFTAGLFVPEFVDDLISISSTFSSVSPEFSSKDLACELHPGALKYYQEQGVL